jgi:hypothetical protein
MAAEYGTNEDHDQLKRRALEQILGAAAMLNPTFLTFMMPRSIPRISAWI